VGVPSDKILARDLAASTTLFQSLDPDAVIGYSPFPGIQRVLSGRDLLVVARHYGLTIPVGQAVPSLCIERVVRPLSMEEVRGALLTALDSPTHPKVSLEVLDFSNKPVPPGRLVFEIAGLNRPPGNNPQTPVVWLGRLIYGEQRSLSVWARVRISVERDVLVAKETIPKGVPIKADEITRVVLPQFPWPEPSLASASGPPSSDSLSGSFPGIIGKIARRAIPAGQRIAPEALDSPKDVIRGETVHVRVVAGAATILLDSVAQSSGSKGESILLHNPSSGKNFRAVIEDRSQVVVIPPGATSKL
jgi:flagella basal body P-ring formation protein FlgA